MSIRHTTKGEDKKRFQQFPEKLKKERGKISTEAEKWAHQQFEELCRNGEITVYGERIS